MGTWDREREWQTGEQLGHEVREGECVGTRVQGEEREWEKEVERVGVGHD